MLKSKLLILIIFIFSACASLSSGERIENIKEPIKYVRFLVIQAFPGGAPKSTGKGRVFISQPFGISKGEPVAFKDRKYRYIAQAWIRGDKAPYSVDIEAYREIHLGKGKYARQDTDQRVAKMIAKNMQYELTKRRKDLNIIDDFRPF